MPTPFLKLKKIKVKKKINLSTNIVLVRKFKSNNMNENKCILPVLQ